MVIITVVLFIQYDKYRRIAKSKKTPITVAQHYVKGAGEESYLMDTIGELTETLRGATENIEKMKEEKKKGVDYIKNINKEVVMEKKDIISKGTHLIVNPQGTIFDIIGIDGTNFGKLYSFVLSSNPHDVWLYFKKGKRQDVIGGKPLHELISYIDKNTKRIFIRMDKNERFVEQAYVEY